MSTQTLSRRYDPAASREAAERFAASGKRMTQIERIVAAIHDHPGMTAKEIGAVLGLTNVQVDRRAGDLRRTELVYTTDGDDNNGHEQRWWPAVAKMQGELF